MRITPAIYTDFLDSRAAAVTVAARREFRRAIFPRARPPPVSLLSGKSDESERGNAWLNYFHRATTFTRRVSRA